MSRIDTISNQFKPREFLENRSTLKLEELFYEIYHKLSANYDAKATREQLPPITALRPSYKWIYTQPYPLSKASLDNLDLAALTAQLPPTSSGYYLVDVTIKAAVLAPRSPLQRGTLQFQQISRNKYGITVVRNSSQ